VAKCFRSALKRDADKENQRIGGGMKFVHISDLNIGEQGRYIVIWA